MTIAQGQPAFDVGGAWASRPGEADASVEASEGVEVTVEGVPDSESLAEALVRPVRTADDAELARLIAIAKRKELEEMHEHDYRLLFERERERLRREREETGGSQVVWPWEVDVRGAAAEFSADELGGRELGARSAGSRRLLDMYGDSLRYVSMLYNKHFGRETRKAPAHMPHFLDRNILHEMIDETFPDRFAATSSHRFRDSHDMQYAFSYFYFLMNQPRPFVLEREFAEHYDLDGDGVLAAFEVRNLYLFLHNKKGPGDKKVEAEFYGMLSNCTVDYLRKHGVSRVENLTVSALPYDLVASCKPLVAALKKKISSQKKYRFELTGLEQVEFYMVPDDFNKAQKRLDDIRVKMPKFICLNDDMNKTHDPDPRTVRVLREFYHSYFPLPSPFELEPDDYHTILHVDDLRAHRRFVSLGKVLALLAAAAAAVSLLRTTWVWGWARMWLLARCRGVLHWLEPTHE
jgi:UDP-N-acetylglucosamine-lysosomal-enzyme